METKRLAFLDYASLFYRRKALFLVPALLVALAVLGLSTLIPRKYQARTITKVTDRALLDQLLGKTAAGTTMGTLGLLQYELTSWGRLYAIVQRLGMDVDAKTAQEKDDLIEDIKDDLKVDLITHRTGNAELILLQYMGKTPAIALEFVNELTRDMIENTLQGFKNQVKGVLEKKQAEVRSQTVELNEAERLLREFEVANQRELTGVVPELLDRQIRASADLDAAKVEIAAKEQELETVRAELRTTAGTVVQETRIPNPEKVALAQELVKARTDLEELLVLRKEKHRAVIAAREKVERIETELGELPDFAVDKKEEVPNRLHEELQSRRVALEQALVGLKERRFLLGEETARLEKRLQTLPLLQKQFDRLRGDYDRIRTILNDLKIEEHRALSGWEQVRESADRYHNVLEWGRYPVRHAFPSTLLVLLVSLALGLGAGLGAVLLTEAATTSFRTLEEVKDLVKVPVMGAIHSILSAAELRRVRRKRAAAAVGVLIVAMTGSTLVFLYNRYPEKLPDFVLDAFQYIRGSV